MKYLEEKTQKTRISIFLTVFVVVFGLIIFRLFELQFLRSGYYLGLAENQHWVTRKIPAERGKIYAKDLKTGEKQLLATNKKLSMVYAVPQQMIDKEKTAQKLAEILDIEQDKIFQQIDNEKLYVVLKRKLTDEEVSKIEDANLRGVMLVAEQWREYPEGSLASHILGFVNNEGDGQYGIEGFYNDKLKGKEGQLSMERDNSGRQIAIGDRIENPAQNGEDIVLTIDKIVQYYAEKELKITVERHGAVSGSVIVMDPTSGDIWAMASFPDYNPNDFSKVENFDVFKNPAISHVYEPGSIFKIITMASGLDSGAVSPSTTYTDSGEAKIGGYTIRNSDKKSYGLQSMTQVLEKSLNTGTNFIREQVGNEKFYKYLLQFGLNEKTGIDLSGESQSLLRPIDSWREINFATASFGQGIALTPIRFIASTASIANGGKMVTPHIVSEFIKSDKSKIKKETQEAKQVISREASNRVIAMMVAVVENGHGGQAKIKGYRIAGKTGTAQVPAKDGSGYSNKTIGSFVLFAPADNPRFVILVKIDEPKGVQWAESTAAPLAGKLADRILNYLEIPPKSE